MTSYPSSRHSANTFREAIPGSGLLTLPPHHLYIPGCSGEAPWHLLLLSLPAGKQQSRSQTCLSLVTAAHSPRRGARGTWRGEAGSCPLLGLPSHLAILHSCPTLELHARLPAAPPFPGGSQSLRGLQLTGQRLEVEKDFPAPRMVDKGVGSEEE